MSKRALLIGVTGNESFPAINSITSQTNEVEKLLYSRNFDQVTKLTAKNANTTSIEQAISLLYSDSNFSAHDTTLLYYMGHGFYENEILWLTTNLPSRNDNGARIEKNLINISSKLNEVLVNKAGDVPLRNYIILDCCESGRLDLPIFNKDGSFCFITSTECSAGRSQAANANHGNQKELLFTNQFVALLSQGTPLSLKVLYEFLYASVRNEASKQGKIQSPHFSHSQNFFHTDEILFEGIEISSNFKGVQNIFFMNACSKLQISYFFPYAYLLPSEATCEHSDELHSLYDAVEKNKLNQEAVRLMITQYLSFLQMYESKCFSDKVTAGAYINQCTEQYQYFKDNEDAKRSFIETTKSIEPNISNLREVIESNTNNLEKVDDKSNKILDYASTFYSFYKKEYFNKFKILKDSNQPVDFQRLTNECLILIKKQNSFKPQHERPNNIPFFFIKYTQELVSKLYNFADQVRLGNKTKEEIINDEYFLCESNHFGIFISERHEEKAQLRWIEELNWAILQLIPKSEIIEDPDTLKPETPKLDLPKPPKDENKILGLMSIGIAVMLMIIAGLILALRSSQTPSNSKPYEKINWCKEKTEEELIAKIITQKQLACDDVSSISSIYLDGRSIDDNKIQKLIPTFQKLSNLEELDLRENEITDANPLKDLGLKKLYLSRNKIEKIDRLSDFALGDKLEVLWLDSNKIEYISDNFNKLEKLKELKVSSNPLREADKDIEKIVSKLPNLEKLWAETIGLSKESWKSINKGKNLKYLYLANNNIRDIEKILIDNLEDLDLSQNKLSSAKNSFDLSDTTNLKKLKLNLNQLSRIEIKQNCSISSQLRELDLSSNNFDNTLIEMLTTKEECFKQLKTLILDSNKISFIKNIDKLSSLTYLKVSSNQLISIQGIEGLKNLQELILFGNQIKYTNETVETLKNLKSENLLTLNLKGNDLNLLAGKESWRDLMLALANFKKLKKLNLAENRGALENIEEACPPNILLNIMCDTKP